MKKRLLTGLAIGGITFGGVFAFAATMDLTSESLGSDTVQVANSCDAEVSFSDLEYSATATAGYRVVEVTVTPEAGDACDDKAFEVTLTDGTTALWESDLESFDADGTAVELTVDADVRAEDVDNAYAVVTG